MSPLVFGKCPSIPAGINSMSSPSGRCAPFFSLYLSLSVTEKLKFKCVKHTFITVGEEEMTRFTSFSSLGGRHRGGVETVRKWGDPLKALV